MKYVKELYDRVNDFKSPLEKRYPQLGYNKKVHIAFMSPMLNKQGLYRAILPALELNRTKTHSAIVTNILPDDCIKDINDFHIKIIPEIVQWAHYIVFPANIQDMEDLVGQIKAYNPNVKIVMDIDRIYHNLNSKNYSGVKFKRKFFTNLEKNIKLCDFTLYPDRVSETYYKKLLGEKLPTYILPNLLSNAQFAGISKVKPKESEKKTIVVMAGRNDWNDINSFRKIFTYVVAKRPDINVIAYGKCINFETDDPFRTTNIKRIGYKDMFEYYTKLKELNPVLAIVPIKTEEFYRPYYKILELSALGIPIITKDKYPYNHLLAVPDMVTVATRKDTISKRINSLLDLDSERQEIANAAQHHIVDTYTYGNQGMMENFLSIFS